MGISIAMLAIFLCGMIAIGIWGMRRTATLNDFFLGGRSLGPWMSAFAYGTTYFSAVLFIGFAGKLGWGFGLNALWVAVGNTIGGALLSWLVLGSRTRIMTQNLNAMTMPEFFEERFGSRALKLYAALIIFVFLVPYSASVFKGLGHLFQANFGIPYFWALAMMIGITGIYLILGGYFAVALTDFVQGIIMIFGAIVMIAIMCSHAGGFAQSWQTIAERYPLHVPLAKRPSYLDLGALVFMTSFGVWALPQMVQKFYAIKDPRRIARAAIVTTGFSAIITFVAYYNGALTHVFFDKPILVDGKPAWDLMVPALLTKYLPQFVMAVILLLVLSASMSTLSSLVLVSSSAVAIDLYKGHINPDVSKKGSLLLMRSLSAVFIVISFIVAVKEMAVIVTLMSLSWGAVAGSFMAAYIYGLFWRRTTQAGVWAGMATGLIVQLVLFFHFGKTIQPPMAASIAMLAPFIVVPIVSLFTTPPSNAIIARAYGDQRAPVGAEVPA